ncbi:hypothetical protein [Chitinophaga sancti]|uniref:hypothetical protein n=1 Tax=Chitinophaga sancti TaxID=1004 RepID=UPI003F797F41
MVGIRAPNMLRRQMLWLKKGFIHLQMLRNADRNKGKSTGVKMVDPAQKKAGLAKVIRSKKVLDGNNYEN